MEAARRVYKISKSLNERILYYPLPFDPNTHADLASARSVSSGGKSGC